MTFDYVIEVGLLYSNSGLSECIITDSNTLGKLDALQKEAHIETVVADCGNGGCHGYLSYKLQTVECATNDGDYIIPVQLPHKNNMH